MTIIRWSVGVAVFLFLLLLSLQNAKSVELHFLGWGPWEAPLILVLLISFSIGVTAGLLVGAFRTARLRRQVNRLRRDHAKLARAPLPPVDAR